MDDWYGDWTHFPDCNFIPSKDDPVVQEVVEILKKRVLAGFTSKRFKIEEEEIIIRSPFKDGNTDFPGSVGWKARISFNE